MDKNLKIGDSVTYCPKHGQKEIGVIKGFNNDGKPFVVYNCNHEWHKYMEYTGACTDPRDLVLGWDTSARNYPRSK